MMWWSGGYDDFESHYYDMNLSRPTNLHLNLITRVRERWYYTITERDKQFLFGIFNERRTESGERAAIVLARNYIEHQTKVLPPLYSLARATNDLTYLLAFVNLGMLKHHVPLSPVTHWGLFAREKNFSAIRELETGITWLIDPVLKSGMCQRLAWRKIINDPSRLAVDIKNDPDLNEA